MTEVWFIRHGESLGNTGGRTASAQSIPLTPHGHTQAADVVAIFPDSPDLIVMSRYIRTQETAAPTAARYPKAAKEIWPIEEFTYLDADKYKNTTVEERRPAAEIYWKAGDLDSVDGEGAESFNNLLKRVDDTIRRIEECKHARVAVFSHGLFLHTLEFRLQHPGMPAEELFQRISEIRVKGHMPNAHIIRAHTDKGRLVLGEKPQPKVIREVPKCQKPAPK